MPSKSAAAKLERQGRCFWPQRNGQASCDRPQEVRTQSPDPHALQSSRSARTTASNARSSLERPWVTSRPPVRARNVARESKAERRILVSTTHPSQDVRPLKRGTFASSYFFRLRPRPSHRPPEPRSQTVESRRTTIAREVLRRAPFLLVSHPFVAHGVAHGVHGVAHGVRGASTGGGSSRGSRWSPQAQRRAQPPVLRPPTALAPTIA
jgi:hypothetical protein